MCHCCFLKKCGYGESVTTTELHQKWWLQSEKLINQVNGEGCITASLLHLFYLFTIFYYYYIYHASYQWHHYFPDRNAGKYTVTISILHHGSCSSSRTLLCLWNSVFWRLTLGYDCNPIMLHGKEYEDVCNQGNGGYSWIATTMTTKVSSIILPK